MKLLIPLVFYGSRRRCCTQLCRSFTSSAVETDQGPSAPVSEDEGPDLKTFSAGMHIAFGGITSQSALLTYYIHIWLIYVYTEGWLQDLTGAHYEDPERVCMKWSDCTTKECPESG